MPLSAATNSGAEKVWRDLGLHGQAPLVVGYNDVARRVAMTRQLGLFVRETECKAPIRRKADTVGITALQLVREMWANLLNEAASMTSSELAREIARIERIQSQLETQLSPELKVVCTRRPSIRGRFATTRRAWAIA